MPDIRIEEIWDIRVDRRMDILKEAFPGCFLEEIEVNDAHGNVLSQVVRIRRDKGRRILAYLEYSTEVNNVFDEFHVLFRKVEPIVMDVVTKFYESGINRLQYYMPEVRVIAHYRLEPKVEEDFASIVKLSGRGVALTKQLESLDQEIRENARRRLVGETETE